MKTYAQNFEDIMLARLFYGKKEGIYIDVGANHPSQLSVTKHFYDIGWRGLNVEPLLSKWELLNQERPRDINLNTAIARNEGDFAFHEVEANDALSTTDKSRADALMADGHIVNSYTIKAITLEQAYDYISPVEVDFIKIDVEGQEFEIITSTNFRKLRPTVILVEATRYTANFPGWGDFSPIKNLNHQQWEPHLIHHGYTFAYFDGINRFYIKNEASNLIERLSTPPGVFDSILPDANKELNDQLYEKEFVLQNLIRVIEQKEALIKSQSRQFGVEIKEAIPGTAERQDSKALLDQAHQEQSRLNDELRAKEACIQRLISAKNADACNFGRNSLSWSSIYECYRFLRRKLLKALFHSPYPLGVIRQFPARPYRANGLIPKVQVQEATLPIICIVTPSYQQGMFLEATIKSVIDQNYPRLRYGIQDGGSTDQSTEIIKKYAKKLEFAESIGDAGQVDAIQRGFSKLKLGPSDIMAWVNSDDLLIPNSLHHIGAYFAANPSVDVVYGHRIIINEDGLEIGRWYLPPHNHEVLRIIDYVPQETMFWRASAYFKVGGIDTSFKFAMDWDLIVRFQEAKCNIVRLPLFIGCFRHHENQKTVTEIGELGVSEMSRIRNRLHAEPPSQSKLSSAVRVEQRRSALTYRLSTIALGK